jgi:hypothetical protein
MLIAANVKRNRAFDHAEALTKAGLMANNAMNAPNPLPIRIPFIQLPIVPMMVPTSGCRLDCNLVATR